MVSTNNNKGPGGIQFLKDDTSGGRLMSLKGIVSILVALCALPICAQSTSEKPLEEMKAKEIWIKYRTTQVTEIEKWEPPQNKKEMKFVKNRLFHVHYPKFYEAVGQEDELDPNISGSVRFERTGKCTDYSKDDPLLGCYSIGLNRNREKPENLSKTYDSQSLITKAILLNGIPAIYYAYPFDDTNLENTKVQLGVAVNFFCNDRLYTASAGFKRGQESLDRIKNKDFSPPQDFKDSISTIVCPEKKKTK